MCVLYSPCVLLQWYSDDVMMCLYVVSQVLPEIYSEVGPQDNILYPLTYSLQNPHPPTIMHWKITVLSMNLKGDICLLHPSPWGYLIQLHLCPPQSQGDSVSQSSTCVQICVSIYYPLPSCCLQWSCSSANMHDLIDQPCSHAGLLTITHYIGLTFEPARSQ